MRKDERDGGERWEAIRKRMTIGLGLVAAAVAVVATFKLPDDGVRAPLMAKADAAELAQSLADAQDEQGVCYGWEVRVDRFGPDQGSSLDGPGVPLEDGRCPRQVVLFGSIDYVCEDCEGEDSASVDIASTVPGAPGIEDLEGLGYRPKDLLGDNDDVALFDMVQALPLLMAERGAARPVAYEVPARVPAADRPTDSPGSDILRDRWWALVLFGVLLLVGPLWLYRERVQRRFESARELAEALYQRARDVTTKE